MNGGEVEKLSNSLMNVLDTILVFLPSLLGAVLLALGGWLLARLLRSGTRVLAERALEQLSHQRLARARAIDPRIQKSLAFRSAPTALGALVYWIVLLFFAAAAIEALGLSAVSSVVGLVTAYLPRVLAAFVIVLVGFWASEFLRRMLVRAVGEVAYADLLARAFQILTLLLFLVIAIDQLGIDSTVLVVTLALIFGASLGAGALAFGLGARTVVASLIASRYVQRCYAAGDEIAIGEVSGRILEINDTAVVVDSPDGRVMVPTQRFLEENSSLVTVPRGTDDVAR